MIILLEKKQILKIEDFYFRCCIGKKGRTNQKKEGDLRTPKGIFKIGSLFYRADREKKPETKIRCIKIKKDIVCYNDIKKKQYYNQISKKNKKIRHETLFRKDHKYDFILPIKYNFKNIPGKGSCIFMHLTRDYNHTAGCIALERKNFLILLKLINSKTKILIK
tara:strand:+ start:1652 stop:2143 length:492 start_codon:yes stop_codon:yes gene_type:complete